MAVTQVSRLLFVPGRRRWREERESECVRVPLPWFPTAVGEMTRDVSGCTMSPHRSHTNSNLYTSAEWHHVSAGLSTASKRCVRQTYSSLSVGKLIPAYAMSPMTKFRSIGSTASSSRICLATAQPAGICSRCGGTCKQQATTRCARRYNNRLTGNLQWCPCHLEWPRVWACP